MPELQHHLLEVRGLCKTRVQGRWWQRRFEVRALDHVDLTLDAGDTLALVGQSGAGKTTLAMCLVGLEQPDAGDIRLNGESMLELDNKKRKRTVRDIQLIFQDSAGALSPRMSALQIVEEPLLILGQDSREEREGRAIKAMQQVGLSPAWKDRRPHELSG
jgi:ABC-type glutathione transport system ATPase component